MPRHDLPLLHRPIVWDAMIALLMIGPPFAAWWMIASLPILPGYILGSLLLLGSLTVAYGSFIEPRRLIMNTKVIRISSLPALKIIIAADFHVGPYRKEEHVRRVVELINVQKPDLILLPGDFLFDHLADTRYLDPLKNLRARYGVWASIGNHDTGHHATFLTHKRYVTEDRSADVESFLHKRGIPLLRDTWEEITTDQGSFALAFVDGPWSDGMNLEQAFNGIPDHLPIILLSHNPNVILDERCRRASLIVSGHTHGGQIRLPFIGALHMPPDTQRDFDQGVFTLSDKTNLAITHGCGETQTRARLLCPPEIMALEIKNEE